MSSPYRLRHHKTGNPFRQASGKAREVTGSLCVSIFLSASACFCLALSLSLSVSVSLFLSQLQSQFLIFSTLIPETLLYDPAGQEKHAVVPARKQGSDHLNQLPPAAVNLRLHQPTRSPDTKFDTKTLTPRPKFR